MAIEEKIAAAKQINELLNNIVRLGGFRVKYRIAVDPPADQGAEWDRPAILVDFSGPDSAMLVARNGELLNALEMVTMESVGDMLDEHDRISFDAHGLPPGAHRRAGHVGQGGGREGSHDRSAVRLQSDEQPRAPGSASFSARRGGLAHRKRRRRSIAALGCVPERLQGKAPAAPGASRPAARRGRR